MMTARKNCAMVRGLGAVSGITAAVLLLAKPASAADKFRYDPASCRRAAHGRLYIALGPNVLSVPAKGTLTMVGEVPGTERLVPLDPTEPEGCPGNPRQLYNYSYLYQYQEAHDSKRGVPTPTYPHPEVLQLIGVRPRPNGFWGGEELQLLVSRTTCKNAAIRQELPNGLTACRVKPVPNFRVEDWAASYVARPDIYKTPLGNEFVVNCNPHLFTPPAIGGCDVSYAFKLQLNVTYRFQTYTGSHPIAINDIIKFDRGLRTQIAAELVEDYRWPEQNAADRK
jgi:hypothetical protein